MTGVAPRKRSSRRSLNAKYDRLIGVSLRPQTRSLTITQQRNEERERLMERIGGGDKDRQSSTAAPAALGPAAHHNKGTSRPPGREVVKVAEQVTQFPAGPYASRRRSSSQQRQQQYQPLMPSAFRSSPDDIPQTTHALMHEEDLSMKAEEVDVRRARRPAHNLRKSKTVAQPRQPHPPLLQPPFQEQLHWPWQSVSVYGINAWPGLPPPDPSLPLILTPHGMFTHEGKPVIFTDPSGARMGSQFQRGPHYYPGFGMGQAYGHSSAYNGAFMGPGYPVPRNSHKGLPRRGGTDTSERPPPATSKRARRDHDGDADEEAVQQHYPTFQHPEDGDPFEEHTYDADQARRRRERLSKGRSTSSCRPPPPSPLDPQEAKGPHQVPFDTLENQDLQDESDHSRPPVQPRPQYVDHQEARSVRPMAVAEETTLYEDMAEDLKTPSPAPSGSLYSYKSDSDATEVQDRGPARAFKPKPHDNAMTVPSTLSQRRPSQPVSATLSQYEPNDDSSNMMALNRASTAHAPLLQGADSGPRYSGDSAWDELGGRKKSWFGSMSRLPYSARASDNQDRALLRGSPPSSPSPKRDTAVLPGVPSSPSAPNSSPSVGRPTAPSRFQRASERAWAALASLQPRMNGYDAVPVAQGTPAPPSPVLGPVDAAASESGSEASDSIEAFSDTQPEPVPGMRKPLPSLPDVPAIPSLDDDNAMTVVESEQPRRYKKVRFDLQEGDRLLNTLDADPGFKVWRDGY